ncbi:MAG: YerC/YecD family TrpR-related protein [Acidimicrobiia bacterium]|nr:YerC/YecD family TrpR-related protein [Acidimicrobiia bacterium]
MAIPDDDWQTAAADELLATIVRLETVDEAAAFMRDLCTRKELEEMSHRWEAVKLLDEGIPYREISDRTGLSTATITRINQWLQHGTGGYRSMLSKIEEST